jgi:hypothetical protein
MQISRQRFLKLQLNKKLNMSDTFSQNFVGAENIHSIE